jgi:HK97 family phage portal protein
MPLELWPIRPDRIEPVPSDDDFLSGYIYTAPGGEQVPLMPDDVISILMPNPMDPYRGLGPVQSLLMDLDADRFAAAWNRNFFLNDASPGGVIEIDQRLSDDEWREFVERWRQGHQGTSNAHRVATLENGAKWKDVQFSHRDMQFSEIRNLSSLKIREAYGMSPHILGVEETVNRATAEAAEDVFARWRLSVKLDRIKDALNGQLLPLFGSSGQGVEFGFDDPAHEDSEATNQTLTAKANATKVLVDAGGKFESVLEALGLPAIEFDQEKIDRETNHAEDANQAKAEALQQGQQETGKPATNGQAPKEKVPA